MVDVEDVKNKVDEIKEVVVPKVDKAVGWRDRYLQWVSGHPKTVAVLLPIAIVWALLSSL